MLNPWSCAFYLYLYLCYDIYGPGPLQLQLQLCRSSTNLDWVLSFLQISSLRVFSQKVQFNPFLEKMLFLSFCRFFGSNYEHGSLLLRLRFLKPRFSLSVWGSEDPSLNPVMTCCVVNFSWKGLLFQITYSTIFVIQRIFGCHDSFTSR